MGVRLWNGDMLSGLVRRIVEQREKPEYEVSGSQTAPQSDSESAVTDHKIEVKIAEGNEMATRISTGSYRFGKTIPYGDYDLRAISGSGYLIIYTKNDDEIMISFGIRDDDAKEYTGLSSDDVTRFTLDHDVVAEITKSKMIEIKDD